jgi:hypothetical protein
MAGAGRPDLSINRRESIDSDEPLFSDTVRVQARGDGRGTPYVTPTSHGAEALGLEPGDDVTVEIYRDGMFIPAQRD